MQTSDVKLIHSAYQGLVSGPVSSLVDLVKAGHLEAAGILADKLGASLEAFGESLSEFSTLALREINQLKEAAKPQPPAALEEPLVIT